MAPYSPVVPYTGRTPYSNELFVDASYGTIITDIEEWMHDRANGHHQKTVLLLLAPPGYGKSWTLQHIAALHDATHDPFLIIGPIELNLAIDFRWYAGAVHAPAERRIGARIPADPNATIANNVDALVHNCRLHTHAHPVLIVDELDVAPQMELAEHDLLSPWLNGGGSVLLGLRYYRKFHIRALRNTQYYVEKRLLGFGADAALEQFGRLARFPHGATTAAVPPSEVVALTELAPPESRYGWEIPAVNSCLWERVQAHYGSSKAVAVSCNDVGRCIDAIVARGSVHGQVPAIATRVRQVGNWDKTTWTSGDLESHLGVSQNEASEAIRHMLDLNIIERASADRIAYALVEPWRKLIRYERYLCGK